MLEVRCGRERISKSLHAHPSRNSTWKAKSSLNTISASKENVYDWRGRNWQRFLIRLENIITLHIPNLHVKKINSQILLKTGSYLAVIKTFVRSLNLEFKLPTCSRIGLRSSRSHSRITLATGMLARHISRASCTLTGRQWYLIKRIAIPTCLTVSSLSRQGI